MTINPSPAQTIAAALRDVAHAIRESQVPQPADVKWGIRLVTGDPVPKPGEISESAMLRLDLRDLKAEVGAKTSELTAMTAILRDTRATIARLENRVRDLELECDVAPSTAIADTYTAPATCGRCKAAKPTPFRDGLWGPMCGTCFAADRDDLITKVRMLSAALTEMRERCAVAAETAESPIAAYRTHDGRVTALGPEDEAQSQRRLCAAAIRALAPAQKGGKDA